jgi:hypothetical protein
MVYGTTPSDWGQLFLMYPTRYVSPTPSPKDGNRSSFRNVAFFRIPDDRQSPKKPSNPE